MSLQRVDGVLVACFAAVVATFVAATVYTQHRTREIEGAALTIQGDAAPSIRHLANARAELRRLQLLIHRAVADGGGNRTLEIESGRALLDSELSAYRRLPLFASEAVAWQRAEASLAHVNDDVGAVLDGLRRGDEPAALTARDLLDSDSEEAGRALSAGIDANVAAASGLAGRIGTSRRRGAIWAVELDAVGVLLAIFAATLALRISHAHARAVEELQHVAERKAGELEAFATRMAHDIRNPLTTAKLAFDDLARNPSLEDKPRRSAARGSRAIAHAVEVIEGLLNFARAGARAEPGVTSAPSAVADEVAAVLRARAEQVSAELQVAARSSARVMCGPGMLASVIGNLVSNALTYVDGATARRVGIEIDDQGAEVRVTVSDTGPGLPPGVEPAALFQPYMRGPGARGRGLGLGLATVSRIVEAHHGRVGVDSTAAGCRFWFTLPRASDGGSR